MSPIVQILIKALREIADRQMHVVGATGRHSRGCIPCIAERAIAKAEAEAKR